MTEKAALIYILSFLALLVLKATEGTTVTRASRSPEKGSPEAPRPVPGKTPLERAITSGALSDKEALFYKKIPKSPGNQKALP